MQKDLKDIRTENIKGKIKDIKNQKEKIIHNTQNIV